MRRENINFRLLKAKNPEKISIFDKFNESR